LYCTLLKYTCIAQIIYHRHFLMYCWGTINQIFLNIFPNRFHNFKARDLKIWHCATRFFSKLEDQVCLLPLLLNLYSKPVHGISKLSMLSLLQYHCIQIDMYMQDLYLNQIMAWVLYFFGYFKNNIQYSSSICWNLEFCIV
jgi:hypothetical protein